MKTGLAKAVKSGPVLQLALNFLITSANSFTFHVLAQNHERDWPYSGDRFLNLASDSGAALSSMQVQVVAIHCLPHGQHAPVACLAVCGTSRDIVAGCL